MLPIELNIEVSGRSIAARSWGPEDGRRILALHGWLDNASSFDHLAPLLDGARVVAVDLPGHGLSDHHPPGRPYHFFDWPADVLDITTALGWPTFDLIGHSMGAGIASLIPAIASESVERLVLIEGVGPLSRSSEESPAALRAALRRERSFDLAPRLFTDFSAAVRARMLNSDLDQESAEILVARGTVEVDGRFRFRHDRRLQLPSRLRLTEEQIMAFLRLITCPVLAIRAKQGLPFPAEVIEARVAAIPSVEAIEIDGGHHLHLMNAESVAPAIRRFLKLK